MERDGDGDRILVARQAERTAHVLMMGVQIGDEVRTFLVPEQP